jgi:metal-responsive CopG/Arc/MetJ family transcriptional regulator
VKREYDFSKGRRGPVVPVPRGKTRITIRLDKEVLDWFRSQVEAAGGGNYQTLINSALREYVRETSSQIAEDAAHYGRESVIDEFGPMNSKARARWPAARRKPGRGARGRKDVQLISVTVEKGLLSRSDDLARSLGTNRAGLIERGLKAVLAVAGRK